MPQLKTLHSRRFLLIYLAVVIMLLLMLTQQYATDGESPAKRPDAKTFDPPVNLPQLLLSTEAGVRSNVHFRQQWTYFVFPEPDCQQHCDAPLHVLRAVRAALGSSAPKVFMLTTNAAHCPTEAFDGVCAVFDDKQQQALLKTAGIDSAKTADRTYTNTILLSNPQAKLQHRYQLPLDSSVLITDFIAQRREFARSPHSVQRR